MRQRLKKEKLILLLAVITVLSGIPFSENVRGVNAATEVSGEVLSAPAPTASPNPSWLYAPIKETFDFYGLGMKFTEVTTNQGYLSSGDNEKAVIVSKQEVVQTAKASDLCLKIPYVHTGDDGRYIRLDILENLEYKYRLGDAATDTNAIVVEMDVAIQGEDTKKSGYRICFNERYNGSITTMVGYTLNDTQLLHYNGPESAYYAANAEKGIFATLKLVIDKKNRTYKYYWNGMLMANNQNPLHSDMSNVGSILIRCIPEATEVDSALYIDNVKLYLYSEEPELFPDFLPTPVPQPEETPVPTPSPIPTASPVPDISNQLEINNTSSATAPASIIAPAGGWIEGDNVFTVACEKPCFVAVSYDGGQTYRRLPASQVSGGYSYTAEDMTADTILAIGYVGDINGDGTISNSDATRLAAIYAGKTDASNALMGLLCDVNNDGQVTNSDVTGLCATYAGKKQLNW